ncbi:MAG: hypothetical protein ACJA01_001848 [Saprospiraceae bacterium]|jgi:hypothetical protein
MRFISKATGQNDDDHYWMVSTLNDSQLRFRLQTNNGGTATLVSEVGVLPLSKWCFIAATYDGLKMRIYKDGLLLDSLDKTGLIATNPNINVCLGNQPLSATGGARPLDGLLDEMRIYGNALSHSEINQVYQAKSQQLCLNNLLVTKAIPGIEKYKVSLQLQSSGLFSNPANILFQAGESIEMLPSFTIEMGASLLGQIAQCQD